MQSGQSAAGRRRRGKSRSWPCRAPQLQEEMINELCVFVLIRMEASSCYCLLLLYGLVSVQIMNLWLAGALAEQRQSIWLTRTHSARCPVWAGLGIAPGILAVCLPFDDKVFFSAL